MGRKVLLAAVAASLVGIAFINSEGREKSVFSSGAQMPAELTSSAMTSWGNSAIADETAAALDAWRDDAFLESPAADSAERALVMTGANQWLSDLAAERGLPRPSAPTLDEIANSVFKDFVLAERAPPAAIAEILRRERAERSQAVSVGKTRTIAPTSHSALLLLPYMADAGLCQGEPASANGQVCQLVDRPPGGAQLNGTLRMADSDELQTLREPPPGSELARILALARQLGTQPAAPYSAAARQALDLADKLASMLIAPAHADYPITVPGGDTIDPGATPSIGAGGNEAGFNLEQCTAMPETQTQTVVVKLDPWAFGLLLFNETIGRIGTNKVEVPNSNPSTRQEQPTATADGSAGQTLQPNVEAAKVTAEDGSKSSLKKQAELKLGNTLILNAFREADMHVNNAYGKRTNRYADLRARRACHGKDQNSEAYKTCYADKYRTQIQITENLQPAVAVMGDYVEHLVKTRLLDRQANFDLGSLGFSVALSLLPKLININIYGEYYNLTGIHYGATSADQAFVVFPYGFSCMGDQCGRVPKCATLHGDPVNCMKRLASTHDWNIRPQGGVIEHGINTCMVQPVNFASRLPYREIRRRETLEGGSGLPYDVTIRTQAQRAGSEHAEPNRCEATQTGDPKEMVTDTTNQRVEHLCPYPTSETGQTDPTPPMGARPELILQSTQAGTRPPEASALWRWELDRVDSGLDDYSVIYAGLESTKAAYETAMQQTVNRFLLPQCASRRTFNGVTSAEGHSFWAWHGRSSERKNIAPDALAGAFVGAYGSYYDLKARTDKQQTFWGLVGASTLLPAILQNNSTYSCKNYPFNLSPMCPRDSAGQSETHVASGRNGEYPMPEVKLVLAQKLDHEFIACGALAAAQGEKRLFVEGDEVAEGPAGKNAVMAFVLERSGSTLNEARVDYLLKAESATPGSDHSPKSGSVVFAPGEERKLVSTTVLGDNVVEDDETFLLQLSNPVGFVIDEAQASGGIRDDDSPAVVERQPSFVTIETADVIEGDGMVYQPGITFRVKRHGTPSGAISLDYQTVDVGTSGYLDYIHTSGRLEMPAGMLEAQIQVPVVAEYLVETDEQLMLELRLVSGIALLPGKDGKFTSATARIKNDDEAFTIRLAQTSVVEGNAGQTKMAFVLTREGALGKTIPCYPAAYSPSPSVMTATANSDYLPTSNQMPCQFQPNQTRLELPVAVLGDVFKEADETLRMFVWTPASTQSQISQTWYQASDMPGTIINDDR